MAVNTAELLARVRQRKKELQSWQWWDTRVGDRIYHPAFGVTPHFPELYLTPAERKRHRKLANHAAQEDKRKRVKLGIDKPAGPKLKVKNAPGVFGAAYASDPTKYESLARAAEDERRALHEQQNEARKLSGDERWQKEHDKCVADRTELLHCAAFRTPPLGGKEQYIVDYTAKQYALTGALLLGETDAYLVLEGGGPQIAKCEKLMAKLGSHIVWKGVLPSANFGRWSVHSLPDRFAFLKTYGVDSIFKTV